jgi:hypothetical protein
LIGAGIAADQVFIGEEVDPDDIIVDVGSLGPDWEFERSREGRSVGRRGDMHAWRGIGNEIVVFDVHDRAIRQTDLITTRRWGKYGNTPDRLELDLH